jgi:creatinine amidohydrolase/Fe(II)-dependent formamide hydrolase-like protein
MISSLSLLSRTELEGLPRELTCFLVPVGGIESHGPHLPLGTKLLHAEDWAHGLAEKLQATLPAWNFVILPLLPLSVDSITSGFALNVRPHVVRDAIVDQCDHLKRKGFLNFAVVSSHLSPRQLTAIEDAGKIISRGRLFGLGNKANLISVTSALVPSSESWASPMIAIPAEHGGALDTALVLKVNPEWVKPDFKTLPAVERPKATMKRFVEYFQGKVDGYWGHPAAADPVQYQADLDRKNGTLIESMRVVLESGRGISAFRSSYRFYPLNGSFFKAYLLATFFFILMLLWVIWSLKANFEG